MYTVLIGGTSCILLEAPTMRWGQPTKKATLAPHPIIVGTLRMTKVA